MRVLWSSVGLHQCDYRYSLFLFSILMKIFAVTLSLKQTTKKPMTLHNRSAIQSTFDSSVMFLTRKHVQLLQDGKGSTCLPF